VQSLAVDGMLATRRACQDGDVQRVYYLAIEFQMGRQLPKRSALIISSSAAIESNNSMPRRAGDRPCEWLERNAELRRVVNRIREGGAITASSASATAWKRRGALSVHDQFANKNPSIQPEATCLTSMAGRSETDPCSSQARRFARSRSDY
jgi:hypothetical protein